MWKNVGFNFVLFLAGLQSIPAPPLRGGGDRRRRAVAGFRYVTLPSLTPVLFFSIVWGLINAFQIFDSPYIMTRAGPETRAAPSSCTSTRPGSGFFQMGYASTIALSLFLIVVVLTLIQFR